MVVAGPGGAAAPAGRTQWLKSRAQAGPWERIMGAQRSTYSPEPADEDCWLACCVGDGWRAPLVVAPSRIAGFPGARPRARAPRAAWAPSSSTVTHAGA
jgi:hypothetical protein